MALPDEARKFVVSYLELIKGGPGLDKRVNTRCGKSTAALHPMLQEALVAVAERFADLVLAEQECFKSQKDGRS